MGEFDRVGTPYNYMVAGWWVFDWTRADVDDADVATVIVEHLTWQPDSGGKFMGRNRPGHRQIYAGGV